MNTNHQHMGDHSNHNHGGDGGHHNHSGQYDYTAGMTHDFVAHADYMLGNDILAEGQEQYGGYAFLGENTIIARSPITGLRPVIDQAIRQIVGNRTVEEAAQRLGGNDKLESAIAQQLTNLNDWQQLQTETQNEIMIMTGINFDAMTNAEREMTINHLQHSPLPFGDIKEVLSTSVKIDMGFTHTLDKNKTEVEDLGDGIWKIYMISNNNNGSHTGHNLGSFKVDLGENADATIAKQIGNQMVTNTNNNAKLYLDAAARDVLYGKVEKVDFGHNDHEHSETPGKGHSFVEHVQMMYSETLIENQEATGGYAFISDDYIIARSTITGLKPVVEQAIQQIVGTRTLDQAAQRLGGYDKLESAIAQQITNLNDWEQLTEATQANLMIMTGVNFDGLTKAEREASINHLLHSPLPFGAIEGVLSSGVKIELGYTHTLDKNKTEVEDLGDGIWEITLISNNNNGSHTGHNMGSFKVDLGENADATIAKQIGNQMVTNTNNNAKLYLDQAARDVLYGNTDKTDFDLENPFQSSAHSHDEVSHMQGTDGDDEMMMMEGSAVFMGSAGNDMIMGSAEAYNQVDYAGAPADYVFYKNDDGSITVIKPNGTDTLTYIDAIWFNGSAEWMGMGDLAVERPEEPVEETPVEEAPVEETPVDETPVTEEPTEVAMEGTDGNDYLFGTAGDDLIDLGLGLDVVNGSAGNDVIKGGDNGYNQIDYDGGPVDYAFYANADGSVTVKKPDGTDTLTDIGGVWFKGSQEWFTIDQLIANTPAPEAGTDDYLLGTDGDDMLDAGAGMDVFRGSMGNDMLDGGGSEYDQIDYAGSREDYSIVAKDGGYLVTKANGDTDMLMDIEGIWFAGSNEWNYIEDIVDSE
ncbi:MAG: calcium-binding protein [Rhizobiaceae bacterium]|nr:calcium-binding protein [Rhizobiaceae bacterium]